MPNPTRLHMRLKPADRDLLVSLAERYGMSESGAVRFALRYLDQHGPLQGKGETMRQRPITAALPIKRYQAPQYLVETTDGPVDDDELKAINAPVYVVLESYPDVQGWGEYTLLIRVADEYGEERDYLATTA